MNGTQTMAKIHELTTALLKAVEEEKFPLFPSLLEQRAHFVESFVALPDEQKGNKEVLSKMLGQIQELEKQILDCIQRNREKYGLQGKKLQKGEQAMKGGYMKLIEEMRSKRRFSGRG
ncbi:MAG TPA: hypothetical protein P5560_00840 [Thermotogota bacterium]|nr:hypothetical protein [Thermotogota bacterium]HRW91473.1 hypothetical protein [Thermotogota bacterium]